MTINTIGKSQGYYPSLRDFKRMQNEDYEGLGKTHQKSLQFWKTVFDLSVLKDDPYLEKIETIKELHKQALKLPVWSFTFQFYEGKTFNQEEIEQAYKKNFACISESAIKRDVKALLKMYSEDKPENVFYELGLIRLENDIYLLNGGEIC